LEGGEEMTMTVEMRPIDSIKIEDRVRGSFGDLRELVDSMRQRGLINPITIKLDGTLVAGERRLRAARELGWTEVAAHVWKDEAVTELLAVEIEENTCRAQLTLTEAEHAWRRYRELLGVGEKQEREPTGEFVAKPKPSRQGQAGEDPYELAAKATGYGDNTLRRVKEIRETAEDVTEPEPVRQVAKQELAKLAKATGGAQPALERVRQEKKKATQAAMAPGQRLKSDEPKAAPKRTDWRARLWDVVGNGKTIRKTAEELEVEQDTSNVPTEDIDAMRESLQDQIRDREYLRKVLLNIKRGR
jgi:ParB-like chromosome segregation protein Spo0J